MRNCRHMVPQDGRMGWRIANHSPSSFITHIVFVMICITTVTIVIVIVVAIIVVIIDASTPSGMSATFAAIFCVHGSVASVAIELAPVSYADRCWLPEEIEVPRMHSMLLQELMHTLPYSTQDFNSTSSYCSSPRYCQCVCVCAHVFTAYRLCHVTITMATGPSVATWVQVSNMSVRGV